MEKEQKIVERQDLLRKSTSTNVVEKVISREASRRR